MMVAPVDPQRAPEFPGCWFRHCIARFYSYTLSIVCYSTYGSMLIVEFYVGTIFCDVIYVPLQKEARPQRYIRSRRHRMLDNMVL